MRISFIIILTLFVQKSFAGWTDLNTGINDELTGVVFWGNNGMVSGHKGLYYTTTGGNGPASWTRYSVIGNANDSLIYEHTKFSHAYSDFTSVPDRVFACGTDTVNNRAVIFYFDLSMLSHYIVYYGDPGTSLNRIGIDPSDSWCFAVGNNGLVVRFGTVNAAIVPSSLTDDLKSIHFFGTNLCMGSNNGFVSGSYAGGFLTCSFRTCME